MVITSRRTLEGLSPTLRAPLDVLPSAQAFTFLGQLAGRQRVEAEQAAARQLVRLCGHLPLALRIAGNLLAVRPRWPVAHLTGRLQNERARLALLAAGDLAVLRAFDSSYERLSPAAQVIFGRLALLPGASFTSGMVEALRDPAGPAGPAVDELVSASLLQAASADRYRMHDLLRLYARRKLADREPPGLIAAVQQRVVHSLPGPGRRDGARALRTG